MNNGIMRMCTARNGLKDLPVSTFRATPLHQARKKAIEILITIGMLKFIQICVYGTLVIPSLLG